MIKQLQEFLKSDHWLRRYWILSGGVFYFEPPCRHCICTLCRNVLRNIRFLNMRKVFRQSGFITTVQRCRFCWPTLYVTSHMLCN